MSLTLVASFVLVARITAQITGSIHMVAGVVSSTTMFTAYLLTSFIIETRVAF